MVVWYTLPINHSSPNAFKKTSLVITDTVKLIVNSFSENNLHKAIQKGQFNEHYLFSLRMCLCHKMEGEFFGTAVGLLYMMHHTWGMPGIVDVLIETIESMKSLFV